jgi:hypothetical protein
MRPADGIPAVLAIDVEPDSKPNGPSDPMRMDGLHATLEWLEDLRPQLALATGRTVNFAWFVRMDPQIARLGGRADSMTALIAPELRELRRRGDGIGLHTHFGRWEATPGRWVVDHGSRTWVEHCLRTAFAAYRDTFGATCRQHRFGDRWSSPEALSLLAELGAMVDLSAEPGKRRTDRVDITADATGEIPSYLHMRSEPIPHTDRRLWQLPLTSGDPGPALSLPARAARRVRFLGQPLHRPLTLDREWRTDDAYWRVVQHTLDRLPAPYLALAIRSDFLLRPELAGMRTLFEALLSQEIVGRLRFTDAVGAIESLRPSVL